MGSKSKKPGWYRKQPRELDKPTAPLNQEVVEVYRIEALVDVGATQRWIGPFTAHCYDKSLERQFLDYTRNLSSAPPEPRDDGIPTHNGLAFAFSNIIQLFIWYPPKCFWALDKTRFVLNKYEVQPNGCYRGEHQDAFYPGYAKLIGPVQYHDLIDHLESQFDA